MSKGKKSRHEKMAEKSATAEAWLGLYDASRRALLMLGDCTQLPDVVKLPRHKYKELYDVMESLERALAALR